jgi:hypothetical protein
MMPMSTTADTGLFWWVIPTDNHADLLERNLTCARYMYILKQFSTSRH